MDPHGGGGAKAFSPSSIQVICQTVKSKGQCLGAGFSPGRDKRNTTREHHVDEHRAGRGGNSGNVSQIMVQLTIVLGEIQKVLKVLGVKFTF
jgi:hypothetical protein